MAQFLRFMLVVTMVTGLVFSLVQSMPAIAHDNIVRECVAPTRPDNDQDDVQWQAFLAEVKAFRHCVSDKMQWHELAATRHNETARQEVERWNDFVRASLNAPEDFPWPEE